MDVISGILARDFGIRPQGNTVPMAASKTGSTHKSSFSSTWTGNTSPFFSDFFNPTASSATANSKSTVNQPHDPILDTFNKGPVFDTPLYDDDIFSSVSGVNSSSNMGFDDDVFGSGPSDQSHVELPPTSDDLLGSLGSRSGRVDRSHPASPPPYGDLLGGLGTGERKDDLDQGSVNDLLPGFSSSVWPPQPERETHETDLPNPPKQAPSVQDDPFGLFSDPLAEFTPSPSASGPTKVDSSPTAEDPSRESSENSVTGEDAWLTVSEIPLFTRIPLFTWPTSAPPPSRAPPPLTIKPKPRSNYSFNKDSSLVNDPEDFALGNPHPNKFEFDEGEMERSSAAMEDAMNKAEAKLRHAKEVREKMRRKEAEQQEREDAEREIAEKEHEERDREDRERERRRIATEEEEKRRKEREERLAVERTTKEARERAAHEAKLRAEEVAVQRAQHEARERAAADREAREKAAAEAAMEREREREAREKAADERLEREKATSSVNMMGDLSAIFGAPLLSGEEFHKIEDESDERWKARWDRYQRSKERVQRALQEMNERDLQAQREQAERDRIAESLDFEIKRWAAGKEGNLRALLSSLHYILWQESGWQPMSLTDLINGADVKKVYRKANLYIHPDKVQQATLQQKYIAEKVFHILKEAWNKFNSEELF